MSIVHSFSVLELTDLVQKIKEYESGIVRIIKYFCNSEIIELERDFDKLTSESSFPINNLDAIDDFLTVNDVSNSEYLLTRGWWCSNSENSIMIRRKMIKAVKLGLGSYVFPGSGDMCYHLNNIIYKELSHYNIIDITSFKILMKVGGIVVDDIPSETILAYWKDIEIRKAIISIVCLGDGEKIPFSEIDFLKDKKSLQTIHSNLACDFIKYLYYDYNFYDRYRPYDHLKNPDYLSKVISVNCLNYNNKNLSNIINYILNYFKDTIFSKFIDVMNFGLGFMITWTPDMEILDKNMDEVLEVKFKEDEGKTDEEKGYSISEDGDINFIY